MIEVNGIQVFGWEVATIGMRNPMNSWDRSDSYYDPDSNEFIIGDNDLNLMKHLTVSGPEHRKFLRMIHVQIKAVIAPLYWWKEYDTYKVGTVANSCSTMHKIHAKEFALADFSCGKLRGAALTPLAKNIIHLNKLRKTYIETKDKDVWYQMIQLLPSSYNQQRSLDFTYENALSMIHQRKNHKLDEWRKFVDILKELPHMKELLEVYSEEGI